MTTGNPGSYDIPVKPGFGPQQPTPEQVNKKLATNEGSPLWANVIAGTDYAGRWAAVFGPPTNQAVWVVKRVVVQCNAPSACEGYLYIAPPSITTKPLADEWQYMVSNTRYANLNENEAIVPYVIPQGYVMYMLWGTTAGTYAHMNVEYVST